MLFLLSDFKSLPRRLRTIHELDITLLLQSITHKLVKFLMLVNVQLISIYYWLQKLLLHNACSHACIHIKQHASKYIHGYLLN